MANESTNVSWYFDFISPFAYLQHEMLKVIQRNQADFTYTPVPVLFAGLLKHHAHKGPAEIEPKRLMTYRYCTWYCRRHEIPFDVPAAHPFNPLPFLRLSISRHNDPEVIDRLFRHIWVESADNPDFASLEAIQEIPGFDHAARETAEQRVKDQLKANTGEAIENGVFGVPTLRVGDEIFWGMDMTEMAVDYLRDPEMFNADHFLRIDRIPGIQRGS